MGKFKKLVVGIIVFCIILGISVGASVFVHANNQKGSVQSAFEKEIELVQSNNLISDSGKIKKICEFFFLMKSVNYKSVTDIDFSTLEYNSSQDNIDKNHKYIKNKAKLFKEIRKKNNFEVLWDNVSINVKDLKIDNDTATAKITENYQYILGDYDNGLSATGFNYVINFVKSDNKWLISQVKSDDEFDTSNLNTDFDVTTKLTEMTSLKQLNLKDINKDSYEKEKKYSDQLNQAKNNKLLIPQFTAVSYDRSRAATWAHAYSANTADIYDPNPYSTLFGEYTSGGMHSDCQNFGSQCVWYGFGGSADQTSINNKAFPMVSTGTRAWFQTGRNYPSTSYPRGQTDAYNHWINVISFASYVNSGSSQIEGPWGWIYTYDVTCADIGDIIQYYDGSNWAHTYVVDAVQGTSGYRTVNDIWVCAHTGNRYHNILSSACSQTSSLRTVRIIGYSKNP